MIDENIIIDKLEQIKKNSKVIMGNHMHMKKEQLEYLLDKIIDYINDHRCQDVVSVGLLEQIQWERDIAIYQLSELGIGFGQKIDGVYLTKEEYTALLTRVEHSNKGE